MIDALIVVTGLSGAGKSTALHALEDLGYYCVDNLPPSLAVETMRVCGAGGVRRLALGMDARVGDFLASSLSALRELRALVGRLVVLFLDASDEVLLRRFSETRRPHPLLAQIASQLSAAPGGVARDRHEASLAVLDGVQLERERLAEIRSQATLVVDTTLLSVHELRRRVIDALEPDRRARPPMHARLMSFGFKYGLPLDADLVLDVRFLENPFFSANLREKTGHDPAVRDFVLGSAGAAEFLDRAAALLRFLLPRYEREGKSYLTVAVGCTGGRHRSVVVASALAERLGQAVAEEGIAAPDGGPLAVGIVHRDVERGGIMAERGALGGAPREDRLKAPHAEENGRPLPPGRPTPQPGRGGRP